MHRLIDFLSKLIHNKTTATTFDEDSRWYLIQNLYFSEWRIPSIWCAINQYAQDILDHPNKNIRMNMAQ